MKEAGKLGQITIVGFDGDSVTLGSRKEGTIVGTVVQQSYEEAYQGMKIVARYLESDRSVLPADGLDIVPTGIIRKGNVDAFAAELKQRQGR